MLRGRDALRDLRLYEGSAGRCTDGAGDRSAQRRICECIRRAAYHGTAFSPAAYSRRDGSTGTRMRRRVFYKRTGTLKKRWTTRIRRISTHSVLGVVGNNTSYAPWVQSREFQAGCTGDLADRCKCRHGGAAGGDCRHVPQG